MPKQGQRLTVDLLKNGKIEKLMELTAKMPQSTSKILYGVTGAINPLSAHIWRERTNLDKYAYEEVYQLIGPRQSSG